MDNDMRDLFRTMPRRPEGKFSPPALGGSSLLVVFAVLSLTVFALLSLSTVRADQRLGEASAKAVADYYAADLKAQEILAGLRADKDVEDWQKWSLTRYVDDPVWPKDDGAPDALCTYAVPISDTQELRVTVNIYSGGGYEIITWRAMAIGEWTPDDSLDVYTGE